MNPLEFPNATDPGQPLVLAPAVEARSLAMVPSADHPGTPAPLSGNGLRLLHAALVGLLALELLPICILLLHHLGASRLLGVAVRGIAPVVLNTFFVAALTTAGTLGCGLFAAYFLARSRSPASRWLWRGYVALLLLPTVAGVVPLVPLVRGMGLDGSLWALVLLGIASGQAVAVCVLRQAMTGIPKNLFQAADIDCVSPWQQIRHVVLPACAPTLAVLAILSFVGSWNEFLLPALLLRDTDKLTVGAALVRIGSWTGDGQSDFALEFYLLASLPVVFLGVWTLRTFLRALTSSFQPR